MFYWYMKNVQPQDSEALLRFDWTGETAIGILSKLTWKQPGCQRACQLRWRTGSDREVHQDLSQHQAEKTSLSPHVVENYGALPVRTASLAPHYESCKRPASVLKQVHHCGIVGEDSGKRSRYAPETRFCNTRFFGASIEAF